MPNWTDALQGIGSIISAATSIVLVAVAFLLRDEVRAARRRPILYFTHEPTGDATLFTDPYANYWLEASVSNEPGRDTAVRVQLELLSVSPLGLTASPKSPVPLRPFRVSEADSLHSDIPAGFRRKYTLAFVDEKTSSGVELEVRPRSVGGRDVLPPGEYRLFVALTGDNVDASYWQMDLALSKTPTVGDDLPSILRIANVRTASRGDALS